MAKHSDDSLIRLAWAQLKPFKMIENLSMTHWIHFFHESLTWSL